MLRCTGRRKPHPSVMLQALEEGRCLTPRAVPASGLVAVHISKCIHSSLYIALCSLLGKRHSEVQKCIYIYMIVYDF